MDFGEERGLTAVVRVLNEYLNDNHVLILKDFRREDALCELSR